MTLQDIFKTNIQLLEEPEVIKLIEYAKEEHIKSYDLWQKYKKFHDKVFEEVTNSETMHTIGKSNDEVVKSIFKLILSN